jgi:2',3'-cyclic-nucleotide 2'-phosphodiesterase (5'-nucleotidase family)
VIRRCLLAAALAAALAFPLQAERLRIVYTNDIHLRLERLASIEAIVAAARETGDSVLLLDAGDAWQDFRVPLYAAWGSELMEAWMDRVGYDAMALGNHDAALGWPAVESLLKNASFPVLCANVIATDGTASPFPGSLEIQVGGFDVLVVGITTAESFPALGIPWLRPADPAAALRREIDRAANRPDLIVCLAHIPVHEAETLARAVPQVRVFVTGHSHETTAAPVIVGNSLIVQSGAFGEYVGELVLDVQDGSASLTDNVLVQTEEEAGADVGPGLTHLANAILLVLAFALLLAL